MTIVMAMNNADDECVDDNDDDCGGGGGGEGGGGSTSDDDDVVQNFLLNIVNAFLLPLLHQRCCSGVARQRR